LVPGTITGREPPVRPVLVRGATNGREPADPPGTADPVEDDPLEP
jgi:hypothetical protein